MSVSAEQYKVSVLVHKRSPGYSTKSVHMVLVSVAVEQRIQLHITLMVECIQSSLKIITSKKSEHTRRFDQQIYDALWVRSRRRNFDENSIQCAQRNDNETPQINYI